MAGDLHELKDAHTQFVDHDAIHRCHLGRGEGRDLRLKFHDRVVSASVVALYKLTAACDDLSLGCGYSVWSGTWPQAFAICSSPIQASFTSMPAPTVFLRSPRSMPRCKRYAIGK